MQLQENFPFYFSTDKNLPFVEYGGKIFSLSLRCVFPHCVGSEKGQKGQSLRKNFSEPAAGTDCSSGDFKTLRGDRACKALSLGEVAAAVRLRITGFGEGYCQQDSDGTE